MANRYTDEQYAERFWNRVQKGPDCWLWTGSRNFEGYGNFWARLNGQQFYRAHRFRWALEHGPIPDGKFICHTCDNPSCVNLEHLWLGTHQDNYRDRDMKERNIYGERHHSSKLTYEQVLEIFDSAEPNHSKLGRQYGIHPTNITKIKRGINWRPFLREAGRINDPA